MKCPKCMGQMLWLGNPNYKIERVCMTCGCRDKPVVESNGPSPNFEPDCGHGKAYKTTEKFGNDPKIKRMRHLLWEEQRFNSKFEN